MALTSEQFENAKARVSSRLDDAQRLVQYTASSVLAADSAVRQAQAFSKKAFEAHQAALDHYNAIAEEFRTLLKEMDPDT